MENKQVQNIHTAEILTITEIERMQVNHGIWVTVYVLSDGERCDEEQLSRNWRYI